MTLSEFILVVVWGQGHGEQKACLLKGQMPRQQFGKWALSFSFYNRESKTNRAWQCNCQRRLRRGLAHTPPISWVRDFFFPVAGVGPGRNNE